MQSLCQRYGFYVIELWRTCISNKLRQTYIVFSSRYYCYDVFLLLALQIFQEIFNHPRKDANQNADTLRVNAEGKAAAPVANSSNEGTEDDHENRLAHHVPAESGRQLFQWRILADGQSEIAERDAAEESGDAQPRHHRWKFGLFGDNCKFKVVSKNKLLKKTKLTWSRYCDKDDGDHEHKSFGHLRLVTNRWDDDSRQNIGKCWDWETVSGVGFRVSAGT